MTKDTLAFVEVPGWPRPKGYANGVVGQGRVLHIAGQIGTTPDGEFADDTLLGQFAQALDNVVAVVRAAGGEPAHIASMTIYTTQVDEYYESPRGVGEIWRDRMGKHFPAMALVGVTRLFERSALVEIQAVAHLP